MTTQLEQDLEKSLWSLADRITPAAPVEVEEHLPHLAGAFVPRRLHPDHVDFLCPCRTVLRFHRCPHIEGINQCEVEVRVVEAGPVFCFLHRDRGGAWMKGSRFYRCDFFTIDGSGDPVTGQCTRVATVTSADGRHWCSNEEHRA